MVAERQGAERENQKRRTRRDLLNAAVQLMHAGQTPSVADVADQAGVSRRTAYRYFATVEQLLTEAALEATRPMIEDVLTGAGDGIGDVGERVERLARALLDGFYANEHLLRTMIRLTIDHPPGEGGLARRGYRRLEWIDLAIAPLHGHLTATGYQRLRASLAVCLGTEAFIVLRDICGLHDAELEPAGRLRRRPARWTARRSCPPPTSGRPSARRGSW